MAKIVISYRREDSPGMTGWIYEKLAARFGEDSIFRDIDTIEPGANFQKAIGRALHRCDVFVPIIGHRWLGVADDGTRKIDDDNDWVRIEAETALKLGIPIIPVLVDGASMPPGSKLPQQLKELSVHQAVNVEAGPDFYRHVERLGNSIIRFLPETAPAPPPPAAQSSRDQNVSDRAASERNKPTPATTDAPAQSTFLIGGVLRTSATIFPKLFVPFSVVTLVQWLPNLLTINNPGIATSEIIRNLEGIFLDIVLGTIGVAIIVGGVVQCLRKETISLKKPLELVIRRFGSIVVLGPLIAIIWILALVLFIIPCLILMSVMFVTIPAYQIERLGPLASIRRSARLTKGYRWKVFVLLLITSGVQILVDQGLEWLHTWTEGAVEMLAAMLIWNTVWGLFASVVTGVAYFELRRAKEGVDVHQIASVFD